MLLRFRNRTRDLGLRGQDRAGKLALGVVVAWKWPVSRETEVGLYPKIQEQLSLELLKGSWQVREVWFQVAGVMGLMTRDLRLKERLGAEQDGLGGHSH